MSALDWLAALYPWEVDPGEEVRRSVGFLDWTTPPETVVRAGYGGGLLVGLVTVALALSLDGASRTAALLAAVGLALGTTHSIHATPNVLATAARTRSLGAAPDLVARAVLRMRIEPAPERAAVFAAEAGQGRLTGSLRQHVRSAWHGADSGLGSFGAEWAEWFPSLERAVSLVEAAGTVPAPDREHVLDRALSAVLDGMRTQMQQFATAIQGPATAFYAFGVLLPTALVALLPAASSAGFAVTPLSVAIVYNLVLPLVLLWGAIWLVARRPVAFPPPRITTAHPAVPDRPAVVLLAGGATGAVGWVLGTMTGAWWAPPVLTVGCGPGVALWLRFRPVAAVHDRIADAERALPDALALVGRRVTAGESVESAVAAATADIEGPLRDCFAVGDRRQRRLQIGLEEAFLGDGGALAAVPSQRLRGSLSLVALTASEGRPAGSALLALADHVEELRRVETEARASLDRVCGTLQSTGALFGPLVAGATVALAERMSTGPLGGSDLSWLGATVGLYTLVLAVLLTALALCLRRGFDPALVGYRVGRALVAAPVVYVGTYLLVGGLA